jgi:hypothetical protein
VDARTRSLRAALVVQGSLELVGTLDIRDPDAAMLSKSEAALLLAVVRAALSITWDNVDTNKAISQAVDIVNKVINEESAKETARRQRIAAAAARQRRKVNCNQAGQQQTTLTLDQVDDGKVRSLLDTLLLCEKLL